ncbi:MAG: hypothetical protein U9N34_04770 [Candidatus Cloacimonadota bacterium]|nr:hypothetical protein [Candidatus Cloacimonadota bacterium]
MEIKAVKTNKVQVFVGLIMLFLGFAIYAICSPGRICFIPVWFSCIQVYDGNPNVFTTMTNYFPDFIHPLAFILITAGLISSGSRINQFFICLGWFFIEIVFEFGQYFKESYVLIIPSYFSKIPILENTKIFFKDGTFDRMDIFSFLGGTITAFCVLLITSKRRKKE